MNHKPTNNALLVFVACLSIVNLIFCIWMSQRQDDIAETIKPVVAVASVDRYNREAWCYEMRAEYRITQEEIVSLRELLEDTIKGNELKIKLEDREDGY